MKAKDMRDMSDAQINEKITELKKSLFDLRFQQATGNLENPGKIREARKTIARFKTVLNERRVEN